MRVFTGFTTGIALVCGVMLGATAGAAGLVLLPNQDFEEAEIGWSLWPEHSESKVDLDATVAHHGKQSLRVVAIRPSDRAIVNTTTETFEKGVLYRITVFVRKEKRVGDSAISYFINYRGGPDKSIQSRAFPVQLRKTPEPEGEWTRWRGLFVVPDNITQWQFCLGVERTVGTVWFDDIRIENLGKPEALKPDVWTNLTIGVEIRGGPLRRFVKHQKDNDRVYKMATRYNGLLFKSAFAEKELRDLERVRFYAGASAPDDARGLFKASEDALNSAYLAYAQAFRSGIDADIAAFETAATGLETAIAALEGNVRAKRRTLGPKQAPVLPGRLGRQDRSVPAFRPSGKMNRLLFGAWSPTPWSEFEKPFELEFHSTAPGNPKVHTEQELDFSNITKACAGHEERGYAGTFSYLMFGIHDSMYAPKWLLEKHKDDTDFFKTSGDGGKGKSKGNLHSLNYFHPAVRQYIRDYLGKYAAFCRNEPRVLFHETSQEAGMAVRTDEGTRESGYGPSALKEFRGYLRDKYGTVAHLNQAWDSAYAGFDAVEPPPDGYVQPRKTITPLVAEFETFREKGYIDYLKLIYDSLKAGDPTKPVVARHSSLLSGINGARIFETCDVLCYHHRAPRMQLLNVYLNSLNRFHNRSLGYMEDFWGTQEEADRVWDERAQRRGLEKHICRTCIWGRTLQMKWYAYTTGSYIFNYNGNWFDPRYDVTTMRYCAPGLAVAKRTMERLDWVLTHSRIPRSRILILQPSATMRNLRPRNPVFGELLGLHMLLYPANFLYELVPEEYLQDGRTAFSDYDVVFLPGATYLARDLQMKLAEFTRAGGTLVALGEPGTHDELARPTGELLKALQQGVAPEAWQAVEQIWREEPAPATDNPVAHVAAAVGKGQLVAAHSVAGLTVVEQGQGLLALLNEATSRPAWPENSRFEVVMRVAENGDRYLFVLNPDVGNTVRDKVYVAADLTGATDVSLPNGFPVGVAARDGQTTIDMQLGPGDCAVLFLR